MTDPSAASPWLSRQAYERLRTCLAASPDREDSSDPSTVWSMPIVLNIPRQDPPPRHELLADAARAVVACCLSPDPAFAEPLTSWYGVRIRKVARRARNVQWKHVQDVPGVTVGNARACVPSAVVDTHPEVRKLQISGTDLPPSPAPPAARPEVLIDAAFGMTVGKAAAQAGHASMLLAAQLSYPEVVAWAHRGYRLQVREVGRAEFAEARALPGAVCVRDAGFTEVASGSVTAIALH